MRPSSIANRRSYSSELWHVNHSSTWWQLGSTTLTNLTVAMRSLLADPRWAASDNVTDCLPTFTWRGISLMMADQLPVAVAPTAEVGRGVVDPGLRRVVVGDAPPDLV